MFRERLSFAETMLVVLIVGVITAIAIPNYQADRDRHREEIVRNNAREAQNWVEEQAMFDHGVYPDGIALVMNAGPETNNPFGGDKAFVDCEAGELPGNDPGVCYYEWANTPEFWYRITANGRHGTPILVLTHDSY